MHASISLLLILIPAASTLQCPVFYDYSSTIVACVTQCPNNTITKTSMCLLPNHYIINGSVHICDGWVNRQQNICCPYGTYIDTFNNVSTCRKCYTGKYGNTNLCCPASMYLDFSNNTSKCVPLGIGACPKLVLASRFKVCCGGTTYYHLSHRTCVQPSFYNCDSTQRVCCPLDQRIESSTQPHRYTCVKQCSWRPFNSFGCLKKSCSTLNQSIPSNSLMPFSSLLSFSNSCCYGLSTSGSCITSWMQCQKRILNRGWSVCCRQGEFYSIGGNKCSDVCEGVLYLQSYCMGAQGVYVSLIADTGRPVEVSFNTLCNGKKVNPDFPFCCPANFYFSEVQGCILCQGHIHQTTYSQICCPSTHTYDASTQSCKLCQGIVNKQGSLCCEVGEYFKYSSTGQLSCEKSCPVQKIYGKSCCESLGNTQCGIQAYFATFCSDQYYGGEGRCGACPGFCGLGGEAVNKCTSSPNTASTCLPICEPGTVFNTELQACLSCDTSCSSCTQPFQPSSCTACQPSYTLLQGTCMHCSTNCLTCGSTVNFCTSCLASGSLPILISGVCTPYCSIGTYYSASNSSCSNCQTSCKQCTGPNQCSQCSSATFLSNSACIPCATNCLTCYQSSSQCYQCSTNFMLYNRQCLQSCPFGTLSIYQSTGSICLQCHPNCNGCINGPQNCVQCLSTNYYLIDQLGVNLCLKCVEPCATCSSQFICLSCVQRYYLNIGQCLPCSGNCQQCSGTSTNCTQCFGTSQITQSNSCNPCSSSCVTCSAGSSPSCTQCQSGMLLYNGNCMSQCPPLTYSSSSRNTCLDCNSRCRSCLNGSSCIECKPQYPYLMDGGCVSVCPSDYDVRGWTCYVGQKGNGTNNWTVINEEGPGREIISGQTIQIQGNNQFIMVVTVLQFIRSSTQLNFYLLNVNNNIKTQVQSVKMVQSSSSKVSQATSEEASGSLTHRLTIPSNKLKDSILITSVRNSPSSTTYFNSRSIFDFISYDYTTDPLLGLQYIGLIFTILISIYAIITKMKGHFIAEQANTLILHMLNFIQVVYLFKFTSLHSEGFYHFANGFGYMHYLWFPNFFYSALPLNYKQYPIEKSIIPDANFIRNAGSSVSFMVVGVSVTGIICGVCYAFYKGKQLMEVPWIRKVMRLGILVIHVTFMNILFCALVYLIQPVGAYESFHRNTLICAIIMLIAIPLLCLGIIYHFYKTYNSDLLEHYYTLRQSAHFLLIFCQAMIFTFAIGKPLICLTLIPLEVIWFVFNYMLYRYGEGDKIKDHIKFEVSVVCICLAYLFLSIESYVHWIAVVVIVGIVVVVLIIYSSYQIVGLYYGLIFKQDAKGSQQAIQTKDVRTDVDQINGND